MRRMLGLVLVLLMLPALQGALADEVVITLGGDCELETMIRALKFITKVLEEESEEVYD